eukprot:TRINITY_DN23394_c0_g1_i1.p1 TRINITY_DN23394_c0_g1~~TRINITY_DN23394_c0_g1_i1.p1  ORF type:complete len:95 (-),score=6.27 TRINITY_DN23394_c0_g1_i1:6-290(-)
MADHVMQDAIAYLQKSSTTSAKDVSLYDHLSNVLLHLIEKKPDNAFNAFENISLEIKKSHHVDGVDKVHFKEAPEEPVVDLKLATKKAFVVFNR